MSQSPIPVTVLSGPLGAGKTTLLNHLLSDGVEREVAVLVNDMGEINIDAELVSKTSEVSGAGTVTELSNGCICCELQDDLESEVSRLARARDFDYLVVESSGISEPAPVARLFATGSNAAAIYDVDTMVTVVNAQQFRDMFDPDEPIERATTADGETRPLSDLVIEQVEFADVVLLNKTDLLAEEELDEVEAMLRTLQPRATILRTTFGQVEAGEILGTGRFDPEATGESAGWKLALEHEHDHSDHSHDGHEHDHAGHDHRHPEAVYGITSVPYLRRRPFHPARIAAFLGSLPESVVRSKGLFWVAGRDDYVLEFAQVGPAATVEVSGRWVASLDEMDQRLYRSNRPDMEWDEEWGDRETKLVFIGTGTDADWEALAADLDDCLLTDEEMAADWSSFENPFPATEDETLDLSD